MAGAPRTKNRRAKAPAIENGANSMAENTWEIGSTLCGFTVEKVEDIPEIDGRAIQMRHGVSQARLLFLENDDADKAFAIGFRTPPEDDSGVFHILEHSVLCGSDKFPVKEPFVNLLKSSMQTFLNAMTFPDKTMYPVASTNQQDLLNLIDVYMDAVMHPAIYHKDTIFQQEGWHLETTDTPEELVLNGVVYNEMKGVLSEPGNVLFNELCRALFPDTAYQYESGGKPDAIPTLSYERFLETHAQHYQLRNSYIILYGNLDIRETLAFLDERYLTPIGPGTGPDPREIAIQEPVCTKGIRVEMDTAPENACCGIGYVSGIATDRERLAATSILMNTLMGSNEAPLKAAILKEQLADDVTVSNADDLLQPIVAIELKGSRPDVLDRLEECIRRTVVDILREGIDTERLEASLSHTEFVMREHEYGVSDGVILAMSVLSSWLYDPDMATAYVRYEDLFTSLREKIGTDYYEKLLRALILDNPHMASVEIVPVSSKEPSAEALRLAQYAADLNEDDFARIQDELDTLRAAQEAPDNPADVAKLPQLTLADIGEASTRPWPVLDESTPIPCLRHQMPTRGIAYAKHYFDLSSLTLEDIPYATILNMLLGKLDTEFHTAAELDVFKKGKLGSLTFSMETHGKETSPDEFAPYLIVSASALESKVDELASIPSEILLHTDFSDTKKIQGILTQQRKMMEQMFIAAGHAIAVGRVTSYYSRRGVAEQASHGVDFYWFLKDLLANFDERADALSTRLAELSQRIFRNSRAIAAFAGSDGSFQRFWEVRDDLGRADAQECRLIVPEPVVKNEAFITPGDVVYAAQGYNRRILTKNTERYPGTWKIVGRALSFGYLWDEVRVKGGAYGTGFKSGRSGSAKFYSYRDPHLDETLARFAGAPNWIAQFDPSPTEMQGYQVSTVSGIDSPMKVRETAKAAEVAYLSGSDPEEYLRGREDVIAATPEDVRALAPELEQVLAQNAYCAVGCRAIIDSAKTPFEKVVLFGE